MTGRRAETMGNGNDSLTLAKALEGRRVGVVLSAGFFGFYGHAGFLAAVEGSGLEPSAYAGTSAGALVAALAASGLDAQEVSSRLLRLKKNDFWDPAPIAWLLESIRGRIPTGILSGARFRRLLREALPIERIEDAKTKLVIATTDVGAASLRIHVEGDLCEAIHASCAYPGLFRTVKVEDTQLWDGGLIDKAPLRALAEHAELDALLVHYLPSRTRAEPAKRGFGYLGAMGRAMAAARHQGFVHQAELCEAMGLPVYVVAPSLPAVSPRRMGHGREVIDQAAAWAAKAFSAKAEESRPYQHFSP